MNRVFLDTGYLIALEASDDQHHEEAIRHWRQSVPEISSIVTTTYVFDEVVTFFNSRDHHEKAVEIGDPSTPESCVTGVLPDLQFRQGQ